MTTSNRKKELKINHRYQNIVPELTKHGFVVMPVNDKKPILKRWNALTKTPDKLYIFEGYNFGLLTGQVSGITVLDIDVKNEGIKIWNSITLAYPEILTPMVKTPSGGIHIYFKYNKKLRSFSTFTLRDRRIGWDLLNNDRQVVAPPSINNATKKAYKWIVSPKTTQIAQMPEWLESYLLSAKSFYQTNI